MKHVIIVNPIAGKANNLKYGYRIQKLLKKFSIRSKVLTSKYAGHITEICKRLSHKFDCRFYCVGGDGTLNEIVTGIIGTNSDIVVTPYGTGNDFIKSSSKYLSMRKSITNSINKKPRKVDVLKLGKNKYCINILSAGFDSMIAKNLDKFRKVPLISGKFKYKLSILYTLFFSRSFKFKIRIDSNTILKNRFTLVAVANGKYYGGGICPCPNAIIDDGLINVCAIDNTSLLEKIILLPKYQKGKHTNLKQVHFFNCKKVHIVSTRSFPANIDGEVFYTNKLRIEICPKAINIVN